MGLQIRTYVEGRQEFIELYGNEDIELQVAFAEIQDITKKNSAFTKEFKVPGTKNNNYIFNYYYDFNSVYLNWNPSKKFEADLLYDGYELYNGYVRLNSVSINKLEKVYSVTFYNGVGDVAANIGDKFLRELDLSSLSHPFNSNVYLQSQLDWNLFPLTGTTNYSYQNGKTFWGLFNIGYDYTNSLSGISTYYYGTSSTSVSITSGQKTITASAELPFLVGDTIRLTDNASLNYIQGKVDGITGTTIIFTPNLGLGTGTYSSWTISRELVGDEIIPDPLQSPIIDFRKNGVPNFISFSGTPVRNFYFKPAIQAKELYTQICNQAGYLIESDFFETNYFERFYLPLKFLDETIYTKGSVTPCFTTEGSCLGFPCLSTDYIDPYYFANTFTAATCNNIPFSATTTGFTINSAFTGLYIFKITTEYTLEPDGSTSASFGGGLRINGSDQFFLNASAPGSPAGVQSLIDTSLVSITVTGQTDVSLFYDFGTSFLSYLSYFKFEIVYAPRVVVGDFDYAKEFPDNDYKQIDFITSVNKLFNLVVVPHPIKTKTLIVEPMIDYVGKGEILDWTEKIDWDDVINVSPTTNLINGTVEFNFKLDKDYGNQQFNISSNRIFGTYKKLLNQEYKDNIIPISPFFGSPTDIGLLNNAPPQLTVANMAAIKNENINGQSFQKYNPFKILPRLVFRGPVLPSQNWGLPTTTGTTNQQWWAEFTPMNYWQEVSRFTTYPFAYSGFSHYINWNADDTNDNIQTVFPTMEDMFDVYYFEYLDDLVSSENKIISAKIYLKPYEIAGLRFDEKILIKNNYYRINKIDNINLVNPGLCNIELVKLTRDYTSHAVKYFDLINCTGGTDYHTTSDLNYNMYAYVGNYVNIFTGSTTAYTSIGCFEVVEGQPDSNFEYNQVFIGSGFTNSSVGVYNDCGCSGTTAFDIVQQI